MRLIVFQQLYAQQALTKNQFIKGIAYSSPFGKRKKFVLPDHSEVTLNSNTTLWLDRKFGKLNRRVQLSGDALFDIKPSAPVFVVYSPHLIITTHAAVARVNGYADMAGEETLVLSGKMKVVKSYYSKLDHDPYLLKDGDMVMMNKDIDLMEKERYDVNELRTWISGRIVFHHASLNDLTGQLKKWFNIEIEVHGAPGPNLQYSGTLPGDELQNILATVGKAWNFRYEAHQNTVTLKF